ncbi:uncharacterized protein LOC144869674 isoform X2 [Branchiostoma floridae x Branchiostoma japonicum]
MRKSVAILLIVALTVAMMSHQPAAEGQDSDRRLSGVMKYRRRIWPGFDKRQKRAVMAGDEPVIVKDLLDGIPQRPGGED